MNIHDLAARAADGATLSWPEARFIASVPESDLDQLLDASRSIKERFFGSRLSLCAILSARGGPCSENCAFCAQSGHHKAGAIPTFPFLDLETIRQRARQARAAGAGRFSLVTSGKGLTGRDFEKLVDAVSAVYAEGLVPDVSPGILTHTQLAVLKEAGAGAYHHNLEAGPSFFPFICTSHTFEENARAVRDAVSLGLSVCAGGIFGIGEGWDDRIELALTLRELGVDSVPINFLNPIKGTPLERQPVLSPAEALKIIALFRFLLPQKHIRICGGRHTVFSADDQKNVFLSGASGIMVGDYLTTEGREPSLDEKLALELGLDIR